MAVQMKTKDIAIEALHINPDNLRFKAGMLVEGIKVVDTYNSGEMKDEIRASGEVPGRLVVEEWQAPNGPLGNKVQGTYYITLAGNRRLNSAKELFVDPTTPVGLKEKLAKIPCNVYKDLDEKERRNLVNDQRSQRYGRAEITTLCWKLQAGGMSYKEIALWIWRQMVNYTARGQLILPQIEACKTEEERTKKILTWLKGTLDTKILTCGRLGSRVRRAYLLADMAADGNAPVIGQDADGKPKFEMPEFNPNQARCLALANAKKVDEAPGGGGWTADGGGKTFNELLATYIREDKGIGPDGQPLTPEPARASAEKLVKQSELTKSKAAKSALAIAQGKPDINFADFDNNAYRLEQLEAVCVKMRDDVKNKAVKELVNIFLTGDALTLESFLASHS